MQERIDWLVARLRKKGYTPKGIADMLDIIAGAQEVASSAWTDALEAAATELRKVS